MRQPIIFANDPDDRVGIRCFDEEDGVICSRRKGHSKDTTVLVPTGKIVNGNMQVTSVSFNHRGAKDGQWYTW